MILISLSGKKQSGKDTVADYIEEINKDLNIGLTFTRMGFADAVYEEAAKMLGIPVKEIRNNKSSFRTFLQWLGTDYHRVYRNDEQYWIRVFIRKLSALPENSLVVVTDVRFKNEYDLMKDANAFLWRVEREGLVSVDTHESEIQLDNIPAKDWDFTIRNNSSCADLRQDIRNKMQWVLKTTK